MARPGLTLGTCLSVVAAQILWTSAVARTILVDWAGTGDYTTIQEGIDAATGGDTVLVTPGTYCEHLSIGPLADGITLLSKAGPQLTMVDGEYLPYTPVLTCENVTATTRIAGFSFKRGRGNTGAGIACFYAHVRLSGCVIADCRATQDGGGIGGRWSNLSITNCRLEGNRAGDGGGISVLGGQSTITGNMFIANRADCFTGTQTGGGIRVAGAAVVAANSISECYALYGGGIALSSAAGVSLSANTIRDNTAGYHGGGLWSIDSSFLTTGNVMVQNHSSLDGGALAIEGAPAQAGTLLFEDNILWGNTAGGDQSIALGIEWDGGGLAFHRNHLADSVQYMLSLAGASAASTLDFTGNWWGTSDPDSIASLIYDCNDDPNVPACVDFSSWCTDASCAGQVTGVPETPAPTPSSWSTIKSIFR